MTVILQTSSHCSILHLHDLLYLIFIKDKRGKSREKCFPCFPLDDTVSQQPRGKKTSVIPIISSFFSIHLFKKPASGKQLMDTEIEQETSGVTADTTTFYCSPAESKCCCHSQMRQQWPPE